MNEFEDFFNAFESRSLNARLDCIESIFKNPDSANLTTYENETLNSEYCILCELLNFGGDSE